MNGLSPRKYTLYVEHDFAVDGGAVGTITLRGGKLPKGAVVTGGILRIKTSYTSGGSATVALHAVGAGDILAATAVYSLTAGLMDTVPVNTAATSVGPTTAAGTPITATIAVAALTAGKVYAALDYVVFDD